MRTLSVCVALSMLTGCALLQPQKRTPTLELAHSYLALPLEQDEIKNINPNRDGDPWIAGGLILPTDEELRAVPSLSLKAGPARGVGALPEMVDNSTKKYFRGIFSQRHGSCAQASAIAYVYGYEVNLMRDRDASAGTNKYPTHWTYNFVNNGYDRGSWMMWGWEVGKSMGIPNAKVYGTETGFNLTYWPSQYHVYENAVENKVEKYFIMSTKTKANIDSVKRYMWNHGAEGRDGGILSIAAGWSTGYAEVVIPEGQYGAGKKLIKSLGKSVNHAVTLVGYDDNICYDYNGDGGCTNDKDTDGDGDVDVADWEIGAFIMANSWGTGWGNNGFIYIPYRLAALPPSQGGIYAYTAFGVVPAKDEDKTLVLKAKIQHGSRNKLRFLSSYTRAKEDRPSYYSYYGLQLSGGDLPLNGSNNDPVEFGLDLRTLLGNENLKKPLDISSILDSRGGVGKILAVSVVDYVHETETFSDDENVDIGEGRTQVEAEWDPDEDPDPDPEPDPEPDPPKPCQIGPVARAGLNMVVGEYCALVLDGSKSFDVDGGEIVEFKWRQTSGPQKVKLENADSARALALIPMVKKDEVYTFELTVVDNSGYSSSDVALITVKDRFQDEE